MAEMILQAKTLPASLFQLIPTEMFKVREVNGEVHLIPVPPAVEKATTSDCPLLGLYADGKLTVEKHHAWSREDKRLENL